MSGRLDDFSWKLLPDPGTHRTAAGPAPGAESGTGLIER
jgi:hypothetical protein